MQQSHLHVAKQKIRLCRSVWHVENQATFSQDLSNSLFARTWPVLPQRLLFFIFFIHPPYFLFCWASHTPPTRTQQSFVLVFKYEMRVTPLPPISICALHTAHYQPLLAPPGKRSYPAGIQILWNKKEKGKEKVFNFMFLIRKGLHIP